MMWSVFSRFACWQHCKKFFFFSKASLKSKNKLLFFFTIILFILYYYYFYCSDCKKGRKKQKKSDKKIKKQKKNKIEVTLFSLRSDTSCVFARQLVGSDLKSKFCGERKLMLQGFFRNMTTQCPLLSFSLCKEGQTCTVRGKLRDTNLYPSRKRSVYMWGMEKATVGTILTIVVS